MKALVTGSEGFAGSHLVRSLEADGHEVIRFDLARDDDITDWKQVGFTVRSERPDLVFHLAAIARPAEALASPAEAVRVNTEGALALLYAVRQHVPAAKVLLAGSSDEYGYAGRDPDEILTEQSACFPDGPYGASKLAATALGMAYAKSYGLSVVVTRAWMHTGPGSPLSSAVSSFARKIVLAERGEADSIPHGDLSREVDLSDVRDIVRAYRLAIGCEPGIYNACSEHGRSLRSVMGMLLSLSETRVPLARDPAFGSGSTPRGPSASAARLHGATGWKPEIPLSQTLGDLLTYWRERLATANLKDAC